MASCCVSELRALRQESVLARSEAFELEAHSYVSSVCAPSVERVKGYLELCVKASPEALVHTLPLYSHTLRIQDDVLRARIRDRVQSYLYSLYHEAITGSTVVVTHKEFIDSYFFEYSLQVDLHEPYVASTIPNVSPEIAPAAIQPVIDEVTDMTE